MNIVINYIFKSKNWILIQDIIPKDWKHNKIKIRSAMATTFAASLELAKSGDCLLEQNSAFTDLKIKGNDFEVKKMNFIHKNEDENFLILKLKYQN